MDSAIPGVGAQSVGALWRGPRRVLPRRERPEGWGPEGWGLQCRVFFSFSRAQFSFFFLSGDHFPFLFSLWVGRDLFLCVVCVFCVVCCVLCVVCCVLCVVWCGGVLYCCAVVCCCVLLSCVLLCVCCCVCLGCADRLPPDSSKFRAFFFPLSPSFSIFFSLCRGLLVEFWWCLKRRDPLMCTFGVLQEFRKF